MEVDEWIQTIKDGGSNAVELMSLIAKSQGRELTAEEMENYFAPEVQKYMNIAEQIPQLVVGQYVGEGELRDILSSVGAVDDSGMVQAVEDMASVYFEIYQRMSSKAGATASKLNSVYAQYLTAQE